MSHPYNGYGDEIEYDNTHHRYEHSNSHPLSKEDTLMSHPYYGYGDEINTDEHYIHASSEGDSLMSHPYYGYGDEIEYGNSNQEYEHNNRLYELDSFGDEKEYEEVYQERNSHTSSEEQAFVSHPQYGNGDEYVTQ
eukprot:TRINITY_DN1005_c0_g1_i1.p1 TRINITY_DN1005_c0_g1~~TRINITY_DN1005_c0_g1_i1.p1  ORF type:complete len:136 (-),score=35.23 TRINITY_DN1005_c0_g1_i1:127-534(-)